MDPPVKQGSGLKKEENLEIFNIDCDWLTYETILNQHLFRKTNQLCEMGLYLMPASNACIFLSRNIKPEVLNILTKTFFPDLRPEQVEKKARTDCPWQSSLESSIICASDKEISANRDQNKLHLEPCVVMPYNFIDNYKYAGSIGFYPFSPLNDVRLFQLPHLLKMWKTASRSCVIEIKEIVLTEEDRKTEKYVWEEQEPLTEEQIFKAAGSKTQFQLKSLTSHCFSIKTGVAWIGNTRMHGKKQEVGIDIYYGLLQSDMITLFDEKKSHVNENDLCMVIFHELLGVMEKPQSKDQKSDGFLLRDLSCLNKENIYIPPLSIPFLDLNLNKLMKRFEFCRTFNKDEYPENEYNELVRQSTEWKNFWKVNYAELLGWAKALLLIRYGLQPETPNPQNFLLEFKPAMGVPQPTGRIFVRDIGDALPMLDIFFALHSTYNANNINVDENTFRDKELLPIYQCLGPHQTEIIKLGWHEYSTFSKGQSIANESGIGIDPEGRSDNWREVLLVMAEWGLAHAKAYVRCIQQCLLDVGDVRTPLYREELFADYPDPNQYMLLDIHNYAGSLGIFNSYVDWEKKLCKEIQSHLIGNWTVLENLKNLSWNQKFIPESEGDFKNYIFVSSQQTQSYHRIHQNNVDNQGVDPSEWDDDQ